MRWKHPSQNSFQIWDRKISFQNPSQIWDEKICLKTPLKIETDFETEKFVPNFRRKKSVFKFVSKSLSNLRRISRRKNPSQINLKIRLKFCKKHFCNGPKSVSNQKIVLKFVCKQLFSCSILSTLKIMSWYFCQWHTYFLRYLSSQASFPIDSIVFY